MRTRTILISLAIAVVLMYVLLFIMMLVLMNNKNSTQATSKRTKLQVPNIKCQYNTSFFVKSAQYALRVLYGKEQYVGTQGNDNSQWLVGTGTKLNRATKQQVVSIINHPLTDPNTARAHEDAMRTLAEAQKQPLWFAILGTALAHVIPAPSNTVSSTNTIAPVADVPISDIPPVLLQSAHNSTTKGTQRTPKDTCKVISMTG